MILDKRHRRGDPRKEIKGLKDRLDRAEQELELIRQRAAEAINERNLTDDALRQREEMLRMFIDYAPAALAMFDREMRYIAISRRWLSDFDLEGRNILGLLHYDIFPQISEGWREAHRRGLAGEVVRSERDSFTLANGKTLWVQWEIRPWHDAGGHVAGIVIYSNNITDRIEAENALRQSEERLAFAVNAAKAGIWEYDFKTEKTYWSPEIFRLIGLDPEKDCPSYKLWLATVDPRDRPEVEWTVSEAFRLGAELNLEWRVRQTGGQTGGIERWLMSRGQPVVDESGDAVRYYGIMLDITDRKNTETELRQSRADLEERVQQRTKELSDTIRTLDERSRQLREMTAELALVEQRERKRLAQVLHDGLQQILVGAKFELVFAARGENAQALDSILRHIDDAIEMSRSLSAELSPPILTKGELAAALQWLARWMERKHKLHVTVTACEKIPPLPEGLLLLFFQAARELLFNVVKHSGVASANIEINQKNGNIVMQVEDQGSGFDPSRLRSEGGEYGGIGLFGIRERLTYAGGKLEIESTPGKGSRFKLIAPLLRGLPKPVEPVIDIPDAAVSKTEIEKALGQSKIRILLVDDHLVMRQGLAGLIRAEADFEVVGQASDGEAAVKLAHELRPDVILMDISMPVMDGIQATRMIHRALPEIGIIGLSMFQDEEQKMAMSEAGATKYLTKSGPSDVLLDTIRKCFRELGR